MFKIYPKKPNIVCINIVYTNIFVFTTFQLRGETNAIYLNILILALYTVRTCEFKTVKPCDQADYCLKHFKRVYYHT